MAEYIDKEAFKKSVEERYCKSCKAESLIFEYRKYREQFLAWLKLSEEEK